MKVYFLGELQKITGKTEHEVNLSTYHELYGYLTTNWKSLTDEYLIGYFVLKKINNELSVLKPEEVDDLIPPSAELIIVPKLSGDVEVVLGAGSGVATGTAAGVGTGLAATAFTVAGVAITYANLISYAITIASLVLSYVGRNGKKEGADRVSNSTPSYIFDGAVNLYEDGSALPLLYGEAIIGSQVISGNITNKDRKKK